jgi:peptidyl-prolyl cis-trans isomerase A (cyclophilin A)
MQEKRTGRLPIFSKFMQALFGLTLSGAVLANPVATPSAPATAPQVTLKTSMGDIVLELDQQKAPKTVANFLQYVKSGFYKGTVFHRVINDFMIQGGGYDSKLRQKAVKSPVQNEANNGLQNLPYTIAMARTGDPNSATSQFFINVAPNASLDYPGRDGFGYTVFGKVISGMDVVDRIKAVPTGTSAPYDDVPRTPVVIESATLLKTPVAAKPVK